LNLPEPRKKNFSEQDTADKLVLPYLTREFGFPAPDTMDYQAQHSVPMSDEHFGRYDGLYLTGGYPHVVLEVKKYSHDLTDADFRQTRSYALSDFFQDKVPFLVVSNGRDHRFYKKRTELDTSDHGLMYERVHPVNWSQIIAEPHGSVRILLTAKELIDKLRVFKEQTFTDIVSYFYNVAENRYDLDGSPHLMESLQNIIRERRVYINPEADRNKQIKQAIQSISLHFTLKVLFIKIVEDLSTGSDVPRIIHELFPREEYVHLGGIFGFKVLNALTNGDAKKALKLYSKSKRFYRRLGEDIARITYQDIFRYGFKIHANEYGRLLSAKNYDRILPTGDTLRSIREELIQIDIRNVLVYESDDRRRNVIGDIYAKLIDEELINSIGAVYTPDDTVKFMVELAHKYAGGFRGKRIVENACGSGHFHRLLYRRYVDEVVRSYEAAGQTPNYRQAHDEAVEHVLGRDIDPFAVQLTLLGVFLEQLKDNVKPNTLLYEGQRNGWKPGFFIDCQNSLDPITVYPDRFWGAAATLDPDRPKSLVDSCKRALNPDIIIGNPPYGVSVVKGDLYDTIYDLQSNDSYGYFIANAIERLSTGKRIIFITSSSFLTIKSHHRLRRLILDTCQIIRIIKLHRATFPGIDIFPVIIELEKCDDVKVRKASYYEFYDLWQLHPSNHREELRKAYSFILSDAPTKPNWPFDPRRASWYRIRQGILNHYSQLTIFDGLPSLFQFMDDSIGASDPTYTLFNLRTRKEDLLPGKLVNGKSIVKLARIAVAKVGLQSPSARDYYRIATGVRGGAVRGGYIEVDPRLAISVDQLSELTDTEKRDGIEIDDPNNDKYFVPLDKAGVSDILGKVLSQFYRPVEFYVNWSSSAVREMRENPAAYFRNSSYYFADGISFSDTGIYSPTFRLSHGGVFDQKSSCIFSDYFSREFLLGVLCSKLTKYFVKVFINHTVSSQVDSIKAIPIALPDDQTRQAIESIVNAIVSKQKAAPSYDYFEEQGALDQLVYALYNLNEDQISEIENWYARRYPKLRRDVDVSEVGEE
jgi:hypothetical protein